VSRNAVDITLSHYGGWSGPGYSRLPTWISSSPLTLGGQKKPNRTAPQKCTVENRLLPNLLLVELEMAAYGYLSSIVSLNSFVEAYTPIGAVIQAVLWTSSAKVKWSWIPLFSEADILNWSRKTQIFIAYIILSIHLALCMRPGTWKKYLLLERLRER